MKHLLTFIFFSFFTLSAFGACSILQPGRNDHAYTTCNNGYYGVLHDGFLIGKTPCYATVLDATIAMKKDPSCETNQVEKCSFLYPGRHDSAYSQCSDSAIGVRYNGYLIGTTPCLSSAKEALELMQSMFACRSSSEIGKLKILFPGQHDHAYRRCEGSRFAVLYNGTVADGNCYPTLEEAMIKMYKYHEQLGE